MAESLLRRIEAFLRLTGMRPTAFGRKAVRDGLFLLDLRRGRRPRPSTERRVQAYLDQAEQEAASRRRRRR